MKLRKRIALCATYLLMFIGAAAFSTTLTGCEEGPLEEAAEEVDDAIDELD